MKRKQIKETGSLAKRQDLSKLLFSAAKSGDHEAQFIVGMEYFSGSGDFEKDYIKAARWFALSAEQGNLKAVNNLGHCYLYGLGVTKDENKAFQLIRAAAEGGNRCAYEGMGHCYYFGSGTCQDLEEAHYWWRKAAALDETVAIRNLMKYFGETVQEEEGAQKSWNNIEFWLN